MSGSRTTFNLVHVLVQTPPQRSPPVVSVCDVTCKGCTRRDRMLSRHCVYDLVQQAGIHLYLCLHVGTRPRLSHSVKFQLTDSHVRKERTEDQTP